MFLIRGEVSQVALSHVPTPCLDPQLLAALSHHSPISVASSACLLHDMDEVAGHVGLSWYVGLEVAQDAVLALSLEGTFQQSCEGLQPVRVVREPKLAARRQRW